MDPLTIFLTSLLAAAAVGALRSAGLRGGTSALRRGEADIIDAGFRADGGAVSGPTRPRVAEARTERAA